MKNKILATVSIITLMGANPALAETNKTQTKPEASSSGDISEDAKEARGNMKSDTSEAYEEIKAIVIGKEKSDKNLPVVINSRYTASGIIGHDVYNEKQESVSKVTDMIVDKDGKAIMVIVSDGMFGIGKKAAFDYNAITRVDEDGDVIMPITQEIIDNAASFSYDIAEGGDQVRVIPDNGYSVVSLMDGNIVNQNNKPVADIENITFKNGVAHQIIVGFDKTLGIGGEKAVLSYTDVKLVRDDTALNFQLSADKSAQFEDFKKTMTK